MVGSSPGLTETHAAVVHGVRCLPFPTHSGGGKCRVMRLGGTAQRCDLRSDPRVSDHRGSMHNAYCYTRDDRLAFKIPMQRQYVMEKSMSHDAE